MKEEVDFTALIVSVECWTFPAEDVTGFQTSNTGLVMSSSCQLLLVYRR